MCICSAHLYFTNKLIYESRYRPATGALRVQKCGYCSNLLMKSNPVSIYEYESEYSCTALWEIAAAVWQLNWRSGNCGGHIQLNTGIKLSDRRAVNPTIEIWACGCYRRRMEVRKMCDRIALSCHFGMWPFQQHRVAVKNANLTTNGSLSSLNTNSRCVQRL